MLKSLAILFVLLGCSEGNGLTSGEQGANSASKPAKVVESKDTASGSGSSDDLDFEAPNQPEWALLVELVCGALESVANDQQKTRCEVKNLPSSPKERADLTTTWSISGGGSAPATIDSIELGVVEVTMATASFAERTLNVAIARAGKAIRSLSKELKSLIAASTSDSHLVGPIYTDIFTDPSACAAKQAGHGVEKIGEIVDCPGGVCNRRRMLCAEFIEKIEYQTLVSGGGPSTSIEFITFLPNAPCPSLFEEIFSFSCDGAPNCVPTLLCVRRDSTAVEKEGGRGKLYLAPSEKNPTPPDCPNTTFGYGTIPDCDENGCLGYRRFCAGTVDY